MGRKAFTLIELIAVIVILSLIALIVFPAINSVLKNSKEQAYEDQKAIVIKAAKQYCYEDRDCVLPEMIDGATGTIALDKLISKGYLSDNEIKDPRNTKKNLTGSVIVTYTSKQYVYSYSETSNKTSLVNFIKEQSLEATNLKAYDNVYKGTNPNNYITFSGGKWRILKINDNDTLTIVNVDTPVTTSTWGTTVDYETASIRTTLNNIYNGYSSKNLIVQSNYCIGAPGNECSSTVKTSVGLLSFQDYKAASNYSNCSMSTGINCTSGNYLISLANVGAEYMMSINGNTVYTIIPATGAVANVAPTTSAKIRPVVTLSANVNRTGGTGTSSLPFTVS